jgi:hypothetical protein
LKRELGIRQERIQDGTTVEMTQWDYLTPKNNAGIGSAI